MILKLLKQQNRHFEIHIICNHTIIHLYINISFEVTKNKTTNPRSFVIYNKIKCLITIINHFNFVAENILHKRDML
jgi:hypothetical protein